MLYSTMKDTLCIRYFILQLTCCFIQAIPSSFICTLKELFMFLQRSCTQAGQCFRDFNQSCQRGQAYYSYRLLTSSDTLCSLSASQYSPSSLSQYHRTIKNQHPFDHSTTALAANGQPSTPAKNEKYLRTKSLARCHHVYILFFNIIRYLHDSLLSTSLQ